MEATNGLSCLVVAENERCTHVHLVSETAEVKLDFFISGGMQNLEFSQLLEASLDRGFSKSGRWLESSLKHLVIEVCWLRSALRYLCAGAFGII